MFLSIIEYILYISKQYKKIYDIYHNNDGICYIIFTNKDIEFDDGSD